ncbi:hypothetical protein [Canibacter oris]|uniref:Uncharacterized protein n=1 Tax=Canibacter oris TaxID=1365628 RepID=A0A840DIW7_9MICO|nr:hypothetical protein [Canibacter oris]MBB4071422.1 hypothetical protein [Canibacter oris]
MAAPLWSLVKQERLEILMAITGRNPRPGALTGPGLSNLPTLSNQ